MNTLACINLSIDNQSIESRPEQLFNGYMAPASPRLFASSFQKKTRQEFLAAVGLGVSEFV